MNTTKTQKFTPSKYQQAIYNWMETGTGNAVVDAVAGSGKTSTIVESLNMIPRSQSVLFLAFNRSIVKELKERVPGHVSVSTVHSVGRQILKNSFGLPIIKKEDLKEGKIPASYIELDENKVHTVVKGLFESWGVEEDPKGYQARVRKLANLGRLTRIGSKQELFQIAKRYGVNILNGELDRTIEVLTVMNQSFKEPLKVIDFTDMIYWPCIRSKYLTFPKFDWVFIDEAQDLSNAQRELMLKLVKPGTGRFVAVGDKRQAIYGFAGANSESFKALQSIPNTTTLPLSICYRCDNEIIKLAQGIIPYIEARENAPEGIVRDGQIDEIKEGDMVLCRNNAPNIDLCLTMIAKGMKAVIKGADIGRKLIQLIESTQASTIEVLWKRLGMKREKLVEGLKKAGVPDDKVTENKSYQNLQNQMDCIEVFTDRVKTVQGLISAISSIFKDKTRDEVVFSSIHQAKGLENDRVFILDAQLMPSRYAKQDWELEQEDNLRYVAYTRAKHELIFVKSE